LPVLHQLDLTINFVRQVVLLVAFPLEMDLLLERREQGTVAQPEVLLQQEELAL
jgi:hypothetical protein